MASRETAAAEAVAFPAVAGAVSNQAGRLGGRWMESATQQRGLAGAAQLLGCLEQTHTYTQSKIRGWQEGNKRHFCNFKNMLKLSREMSNTEIAGMG